MDNIYVFLALLGGFLPALVWLWFWLREDKKHPEPVKTIVRAFLGGVLVVFIALPLQKLALDIYTGTALVIVWVVIEEALKYAAALALIFWSKVVDEPIDYVIYLITIALGFSALENALFLFTPLASGDLTTTLLTGKFRFLGATLLHVLSSGIIGMFLAFAFYKSAQAKLIAGTIGLFIAIALHALFNVLIMDAQGETILGVFVLVWIGIVALFFLFERIKRIVGRTPNL